MKFTTWLCLLATTIAFTAVAAPTPAKKKKPKSSATPKKSTVVDAASPEPMPKHTPAPSPSTAPTGDQSKSAPNASLSTDDLAEFDKQPARVKKVISAALDLTTKNLTYAYGSADPAAGGMDCSGFVFYVLNKNGYFDAPRDSSGQYSWLRKRDTFRAVVGRKADSFEFNELEPGDLLFWTGTYSTEKDPPISHVMIYLGTEKKRDRKVMVGSSDGRSYDGKQRWGVSVFDFVMPSQNGKSSAVFVGYARLPGIRD